MGRKLPDVLNELLKSQANLALYQLPDDNKVQLVAADSLDFGPPSTLFDNSGFVLHPFSASRENPVIRIPTEVKDQFTLEEVQNWKGPVIIEPNRNLNPAVSSSDYIDHVNQLVQEIRSGTVEKVIAWRKKEIPFQTLDAVGFFARLCSAYPSAFVYLCYTQTYGWWLGASPETLVSYKSGNLHTTALAGSQPWRENLQLEDWSNKEMEEHFFVVDYIDEVLREKASSIEKGKTFTDKAGPMAHLRTNFSGKIDWGQLNSVVRKLHPTPAVGGFPKKEALEWIENHEKDNRLLYTGFLGPIEQEHNLNLFVNLRCMQILRNKVSLYLGGGITADSDPEKEWQETEDKARTLTQFLSNFIDI